MPPYRLELLPDRSVLLWTIDPDFDFERHLSLVAKEATTLLDIHDQRVVYMADARRLQLSHSTMLFAVGMLTKDQKALFQHPQISRIIGIGSSELLRLAFTALGQARYRNLPVTFFQSLDEAFASL